MRLFRRPTVNGRDRQAVQDHLEQLKNAGLLRVRPSRRSDKRAQNEYLLNQPSLYALVEEFRGVAALGGFVGADPFETVPLAAASPAQWEAGAKLVLVHGAHEGKVFPLRQADLKDNRGWIIGRRLGASVCLDYDPFVSGENAEVNRGRDGFRLMDLRNARNGTYLNWQRLPVGGEAPLQPGDVVSVGRSSLVFRAS